MNATTAGDVRLAIIWSTPAERLIHETSILSTATVLELKEQLYKSLVGRPHTSGQVLSHLGRNLENSEVLGQICNVPKVEIHTLYMTILAHSWGEKPPQGGQPNTTSPSATALHPHQLISPGDVRARVEPRNERAPLSYIHWLHYNAIRALLGYPAHTIQNPLGRSMEAHKQDAMNFYAWSNVKWPMIFTRELELLNTPREYGEGVQYGDFDGSIRPIMRLQAGSLAPTALQKLALEIMSYTYPLLSIELSPAQLESLNPRHRLRKARMDAYLQAVNHAWANNLPVPAPPQLDDRPPPGAVANRQVIVRVGVDTVLLVVRAALVYWVFRPFTRTLTGCAYVAWILYELWQLWARPAPPGNEGVRVRQGGGNANGGHPAGGGPAPIAGGAAAQPPDIAGNGQHNHNDQPIAPAGGVAAHNGANGHLPAANGPPGQGDIQNQANLWQRYARLGLPKEAEAAFGVNGGQPNGQQTEVRSPSTSAADTSRPPSTVRERRFARLGLGHRCWMFITMLVLTIHPRYWTERQQVLRERERELRVTYGPLRDDEQEGEQGNGSENGPRALTNGQTLNGTAANAEKAEPLPRPPPGWVGDYVDRARRGLL